MYAVHYIDQNGQPDQQARLDFDSKADALRAYKALAANFEQGRYGPEVAEIALYDEALEELLDSTSLLDT
jgi:hypothetical protein